MLRTRSIKSTLDDYLLYQHALDMCDVCDATLVDPTREQSIIEDDVHRINARVVVRDFNRLIKSLQQILPELHGIGRPQSRSTFATSIAAARAEFDRVTTQIDNRVATYNRNRTPNDRAPVYIDASEEAMLARVSIKEGLMSTRAAMIQLGTSLECDIYDECATNKRQRRSEYDCSFGRFDITKRMNDIKSVRTRFSLIRARMCRVYDEGDTDALIDIDIDAEMKQITFDMSNVDGIARIALTQLLSMRRFNQRGDDSEPWRHELESAIEVETRMLTMQFNSDEHNSAFIDVTDYNSDSLNNFAIKLTTQGHTWSEQVQEHRRGWSITSSSKQSNDSDDVRIAETPPNETMDSESDNSDTRELRHISQLAQPFDDDFDFE